MIEMISTFVDAVEYILNKEECRQGENSTEHSHFLKIGSTK